ncbi:cleavage/polyadenylation factor ia subunit clp1p [Capsaspora owczarzaki ATCC 30864]|uniref:Protein CLP1 homolog n=1 Tax=Capsaspora owczarzaki (strain ATCC 30864) TaxID=595528 RepID=A0A0D2VKI7_CAPO3|nr:cleavage/polyadenylation factor ia subunit clp1p [Capsaspora owczarzaki ATCC 30864]KJE90532.1 cleavage/polyadenylation factor ia subunit clp1p [Capsaspora owczarzaki ATCC 30864]|eukprot:XP_004364705.1 cleavage/polyadenylation factor ia subunit clp1p [Capsaspora owczarzaki ATCC 30864]
MEADPPVLGADTTPPRSFTLNAQHELRVEIDNEKRATITVLSGTAEIFGTELAVDRAYTFSGAKLAVFSWHGATVQIAGPTEVAYVSKETPMTSYVNTHAALEQLRIAAERMGSQSGPRVLIAGAGDVGKSSLCKILLSYAARSGRRPLYVDLDVGQGSISVPGVMATALVEKPVDVEEGFSNHIPLLYHFGHLSPDNHSLYKSIMGRIATAVTRRCQSDAHTRHSGVIINTCGWIEGPGFQFIMSAIDLFQVDVVLTIDSERLHHDIATAVNSSGTNNQVAVVSLPKSGGVVSRPQVFRRKTRNERVKQYFYGIKNDLFPSRTTIKLNDFVFVRIGAPPVPASCLPLGETPANNELKVITVTPSTDLLYTVLSVSASPQVPSNLQSLVDTNVLGFVFVAAVNMDKKELTILAPSIGRLPSNVLIVSAVKCEMQL